jgi:hypothetical protein
VIPAVEALKLERAQLTPEDIEAINALELEIEAHVRENMEWRGVQFESKEKRPNIIAEVIQRLKVAGYEPRLEFMVEPHPLNKAIQQLVGFRLSLSPNDEAYRAATRALLS